MFLFLGLSGFSVVPFLLLDFISDIAGDPGKVTFTVGALRRNMCSDGSI